MSDTSSIDGGRGGRPSSRPNSPGQGNSQVHQLFARLTQEIEEKNPANVIFFIVDFLCKHYPKHLAGFASIWNGGKCYSDP